MHSAQPDDSSYGSDASQSAAEQDAWRALVSSRVNRYRALRKRKDADDLPALDFGAPAETDSVPRPARASAPEPAARAPHNAFDTNYYRRLNAESLSAGSYAQDFRDLMGATAAAIEPVQQWEAEHELNSADTDEESPAATCQPQMPDLELHPESSGDPGLDRYCISEPEPQMKAEPEFKSRVESEVESQLESEAEPEPQAVTQGNLIVFRRPLIEPPLAPQPSRDELAEPMNTRPRILEVPEDIMPAVQGSLFPEIRLDSDEAESSAPREPEIEVPLAVAQVSDRFVAGIMDAGVVLAATLLFAAIAWVALPEVPHTKPFFMVLGAVGMLLWAVYQHMFLLYAGRTLGMSLRGIRLSTFDGHTPQWTERGSRARFMFISMASVMLGFLWALVDEDMLCWHDRISRTFPTTG